MLLPLLVGGRLAGFTRTDWRGEKTVDAKLKPPWMKPMTFPLCLGNEVTAIIVVARKMFIGNIYMMIEVVHRAW